MDRKANATVRGHRLRLKLSCGTKTRRVPRAQQGSAEIYCASTESLPKKSSSIRGILSLAGHKSSGSTLKALARQSNSKSDTHRNCVSIFARVSRLKSHPQRRQRAASIGCVNCRWSRRRRICGPTRFRGLRFMFRYRNTQTRKSAALKGSEFRTSWLSSCQDKKLWQSKFILEEMEFSCV